MISFIHLLAGHGSVRVDMIIDIYGAEFDLGSF